MGQQPDAARGQTALAVPTDVTDPDSVLALFDRIAQRFGRPDLLFNNDSISAHTPRPLAAPYTLSKHAVTGQTKALAPAGTPRAIVDRLNAEINAALKLQDVRAELEAAGIVAE